MINEEKIRMMTEIALLEKKEQRRAIEICGYRKKDYVSFQMVKTWACYTAAYMLITAVSLVCAGGSMQTASFWEDAFMQIVCVWAAGYLVLLAAVLTAARRCYSRRYRAAAVVVRLLRHHLMALEDYYGERNQVNDSSAGTAAKDK